MSSKSFRIIGILSRVGRIGRRRSAFRTAFIRRSSNRHVSRAQCPRATNLKILVVEDEKRMAQVLRKGLEEESHAVRVAGDGSAALELAENTTFDLILLDVMLPGVNGI